MMSNKELLSNLKRLKEEGITYKYIAQHSGVNIDTLYSCNSRQRFPMEVKQQLEDFILSNYINIICDN